MTQDDTETRILNLLETKGVMTTLEISEKLKISRNTAAKYLSILRNKGSVQVKEAGPAKLWSRISAAEYQQLLRQIPYTELFAEAIDKALGMLGTSSKQAIYYNLGEDAAMKEMLEKPELLQRSLEKIFGVGAQIIEGAIIAELSHMTGYKVNAQDIRDINLTSYVENLALELKKRRTE